MNYFLTTERLGFRKWSIEDLNIANDLWGDDKVTEFIGGHFTEKKVKERLLTEIDNDKKYAIQYWPIFLLTSGENVGCCGLRPYDVSKELYEIGFHIRSKFWGKGFAMEAAKKVIEYACSNLNINGLFAGHNPKNEKSRNVLKKLGFKFTHEEYYVPTGLMHPSYILKLKD